MITLRNMPLYTRSGLARDKRYTFVHNVAYAAGNECVKAHEKDTSYSDTSYWAGYRNALYMVLRLIEGNIDDTSDIALSNGLDTYNEWLVLRGEEK